MSDRTANTSTANSLMAGTSTAKATNGVGRADWIAALLLAVALGIVYGRAARAPFVHDDNISVLHNPSIVRLWPLFGTAAQSGPLRPPRDAVTSGRPLVNLTLALNYAIGGYDPVGYHVVNLLIHIGASILLYGIVRRTLLLERFRERFGVSAFQLALAVALVWAIHPLQTDAVEYVSQRTESLMGLFYLATLYASVRYFTAETRQGRTLVCARGGGGLLGGNGLQGGHGLRSPLGFALRLGVRVRFAATDDQARLAALRRIGERLGVSAGFESRCAAVASGRPAGGVAHLRLVVHPSEGRADLPQVIVLALAFNHSS